jgi:CheY-like chemotaxis protein
VGAKILIVDDDPVIVKYLSSLFENNGYEVDVASDGVEGAERVKESRPDLITLDLDMPREWGPRFYRKLTKSKELKEIPVIVISGLPSSKYSLKKAAAHLSKPFDPDELLDIVRKALDR